MGHWLPSATLTKLPKLTKLTNLTNLAKNTLATNFLAPCLPFYSKNIPGTKTKQYDI